MMKSEIALHFTSRFSRKSHSLMLMSRMVGYRYFASTSLSHLHPFPYLESVYSLATLESKLVAYVADPAAAAQPFEISSIPKVSRGQAAQEAARKFTYSKHQPLF